MIYKLGDKTKVKMFGLVPQKNGAWHNGRSSEHDIIIYCTKGKINMLVEDAKYHLCVDDVLLIPRNTFYKPLEGESCEYYFFNFQSEVLCENIIIPMRIATFVHPWLTEGYAYTCIDDYVSGVKITKLKNRANYRIKYLFELAKSMQPGKRFTDQLLLDNILHALLICIGDSKKTLSNHLSKITDYIHHNYKEKLSLSSLSARFCLSQSYIIKMFKTELNTKPSEYVNQIRIAIAKKLLTETDLSITEVSEEVGYSDIYYFSKVFKKIIGVPPSSLKIRIQYR